MAILKKILFPGMTEAAQIAVTQLKPKADAENAINALTLTGENTKVDDNGHPVYTIGLAVDGKTILKGENDALKSGLKLVYHEANKAGDTEQSAHIALTDNDGVELSVIPVSNIVGNGVLKSSAYDAATGILTLTFAQADGTEKAVEVDLKAMLDINDMSIAEGSKNYLEVALGTAEGATQAVFGAKIVKVAEATNSKTGLVDAKDVKDYVDTKATDLSVKAQGDDYITAAVDETDNKKIKISADVQKLTAIAGTVGVYDAEGAETTAPVVGTLEGVAQSLVDGADVATKVKTYVDGAIAIEVARADAKVLAAVKALDVTDAAEAGKYVSAVSETDGKVAITRANVADAVLNGYAKGVKPASGKEAVAATDDVKGAIAKLEHQVDAAKAAATTKVVEGTDAGNNLEIASAKETDGSTTYTINLSDVASKTALDTEIAAREAADTTLTQDLAAEVTRAQNAEKEIADKVGLTGDEGSRTFTPTPNYGGASTTVMANMQAIDTKLQEVETKVAGVQYKVNGTTLEFFGITEKTA